MRKKAIRSYKARQLEQRANRSKGTKKFQKKEQTALQRLSKRSKPLEKDLRVSEPESNEAKQTREFVKGANGSKKTCTRSKPPQKDWRI